MKNNDNFLDLSQVSLDGLAKKTQGETQSTVGNSQTTNPWGDLEISKHLYQTGLQNVFNDYQKNVANLDSAKQQSLQDAYHIKKMSKKYLGEYASNVGMGDVSGHLLDIYGNYQQNLQSIQENFGELQLNLEKEYQRERMDIMSNLLYTEHNIEMAKLNERANQVLFNAMTGDTEGLSPFDYLENHREELGESNFRAIYESLYTQVLEEVTTNIQQGFFGYLENEEGEMVRSNDPKSYLQQFKGILNESHYNMLQGALPNPSSLNVAFQIARGDYGDFESGFVFLDSIRDTLSDEEYIQYYSAIRDNVINEMRVRAENNFFGYKEGPDGERIPITAQEYLDNLDSLYGDVLGSELEYSLYREQIEFNKNLQEEFEADNEPIIINDITTPERINPETGEIERNTFYDSDLDLYGYALFSGDDFSTTSQAYEIEGMRYVKISNPVDNDEIGRERLGSDYGELDAASITQAFIAKNDGAQPSNGQVFFHNGFAFIRDANNWHRLEVLEGSNMTVSQTEMALWDTDNNDQGYMSIDTRWPRKDVISIGGREYKVDGSDVGWEGVPEGVKKLFEQVHGADFEEGLEKDGFGDRNRARVVYYNGQFWYAKTQRGWGKGVRYMPMKRND